MNETYCRLKALLLGWGSVGVVYSTTDVLQRVGYKLPPLWVDTLLDFSPSAIWLYLSFFILIPLGYWLTPLSQVKCLMRATQLAALFAGIIYLAWPSTMDYPAVSGEGVSVDLLRLLLAVDSSQNCFPSLHMALTLLMVWGISRRGQWQYTLGAAIWGGGHCGLHIAAASASLYRSGRGNGACPAGRSAGRENDGPASDPGGIAP